MKYASLNIYLALDDGKCYLDVNIADMSTHSLISNIQYSKWYRYGTNM